MSGYFARAHARLAPGELVWAHEVIDHLGWRFADPGELMQLVYRAGVVLGVVDIFARPPVEVARLVLRAEVQRERARAFAAGTTVGGGGELPPAAARRDVIPLAWLVPELVNRVGVSLAQLGQLVAPAHTYVRYRSDDALATMAALLDQWTADLGGPPPVAN